jgi:hypothetical protein
MKITQALNPYMNKIQITMKKNDVRDIRFDISTKNIIKLLTLERPP